MKTTVKQRLKDYLAYKGIGQVKFAESVGLSRGFVNNISQSIQPKTMDRITKCYGDLNPSWLLTGNGDMIVDGAEPINKVYHPHVRMHTIRYYPCVTGTMGGLIFLDDPDESFVDMTIPGYDSCRFAIPAHGDSMVPTIPNGAVVLLSEWKERFWEWGKIYLIITINGYRTIKRVMPGDSPDTIKCVSDNSESSPPFTIPLSDISNRFLVCGWLSRDVV